MQPFNIKRAKEIFDQLLYKGGNKLFRNHIIPTANKIKGKNYCNWNGSQKHETKSYVVFKNQIKKALQSRHIYFLDKQMKVAIDSFFKIITKMVTPSLMCILESERCKRQELIDHDKDWS